jgi:hypothetical protein
MRTPPITIAGNTANSEATVEIPLLIIPAPLLHVIAAAKRERCANEARLSVPDQIASNNELVWITANLTAASCHQAVAAFAGGRRARFLRRRLSQSVEIGLNISSAGRRLA